MDQLEQWFPNYDRDLERMQRFWAGEGRYVITVQTSQYNYRQTFDDSKMVDWASRGLYAQSRLPGLNLPSFFTDLGTISTAKYWGGHWHAPEGDRRIYIDPVAQTLDEALAIKPRPVDDPEMDFAHGLHLYRQILKNLNTDLLWMRTPDMQGPLTTAGLVMNQENLLIALHEDKAKVHQLLDAITQHLIALFQYLQRETNNKLCGNIWPNTFFPSSMGMSYTEDLMPLLSPQSFKEFGLPRMRELAAATGGLHIHCCGVWGRHVRNLADANLPIKAVEFHFPETKIEELEPLADQAVIVPYILLEKTDRFQTVTEYYRYLLEQWGSKFRFWFACAEDTPEFLSFAETFGNNISAG